jgi:hypothetical protein
MPVRVLVTFDGLDLAEKACTGAQSTLLKSLFSICPQYTSEKGNFSDPVVMLVSGKKY